jgi:hypothetical protein
VPIILCRNIGRDESCSTQDDWHQDKVQTNHLTCTERYLTALGSGECVICRVSFRLCLIGRLVSDKRSPKIGFNMRKGWSESLSEVQQFVPTKLKSSAAYPDRTSDLIILLLFQHVRVTRSTTELKRRTLNKMLFNL